MFGRPEEVNATQKTQEQGRIAQRSEAAADIGHQEDEENKGIATFFMSATIAFLLFGGLISSRRIEGPKFTFFNDVDYEVYKRKRLWTQ